MKKPLYVVLICLLVLGGFACDEKKTSEEAVIGSCLTMDNTIDDDVCTMTTAADCSGWSWEEGTCQAAGWSVSCGGGKYVESGVICPGGGGATACLYSTDNYDDICIEEDEDGCAELDGEVASGTCEEIGFAVECGNLWLEEGADCPGTDVGSCVLYNENLDDICVTEEEIECVESGGDWDPDTCESWGYTVDCGNDTWIWEGADCSDL
jgi:hypothetical protein